MTLAGADDGTMMMIMPVNDLMTFVFRVSATRTQNLMMLMATLG